MVLVVDLRVFWAGNPVSRQMRDVRVVLVAYLQAFYGFLKILFGATQLIYIQIIFLWLYMYVLAA